MSSTTILFAPRFLSFGSSTITEDAPKDNAFSAYKFQLKLSPLNAKNSASFFKVLVSVDIPEEAIKSLYIFCICIEQKSILMIRCLMFKYYPFLLCRALFLTLLLDPTRDIAHLNPMLSVAIY